MVRRGKARDVNRPGTPKNVAWNDKARNEESHGMEWLEPECRVVRKGPDKLVVQGGQNRYGMSLERIGRTQNVVCVGELQAG